MSITVLNVAEKPSVAKAIAETLGKSPNKGVSLFNPVWDFDYTVNGQNCHMLVTSVSGHLKDKDFPEPYNKSWSRCEPIDLFKMQINSFVPKDMIPIAKGLEQEVRQAQWLILWLDCDLEGENIAYEVIDVCSKAKRNLVIYRAHFSDLSPTRAITTLQRPNSKLSEAVEARRELDLRLGAIFTRFQTLKLGKRFQQLQDEILSYGPCQFPTLGFIVDRFWKIKCHVPEDFYSIKCTIEKAGQSTGLKWSRGHLFDRLSCLMLYEMCVENPKATVTSLQSKPTKKWKPYPLTTVDLQKAAAKFMRISSADCMKVAEKLYNEGYLSYPRTETAGFADDYDLHSLVRHQTNHPNWGNYATSLLNDGKFARPRKGKGDDKSHPPIHPTKPGDNLNGLESQIYEFVARHFLACCSADATGNETNVEISIVDELFRCQGLMITERNFLDVYPYWKWNAKTIPHFVLNEQLNPTELFMKQGQTSPAKLLTEEELIGLMDKNGIGTDATIAEHIQTVIKRGYAVKEGREIKPTTLGEALVAGYNAIGLRLLSQPNLRAKTEGDMKGICEGRKTRQQVIDENVEMYKKVYTEILQSAPKLLKALARFFDEGTGVSSLATDFDREMRNFSICGKCSNKMNMRIDTGTGKAILFCGSCKESHNLPSRSEISAHDHICPLCNFQVVHILSHKGTEYELCPHCYNNPPDDFVKSNQDSLLATTMPCFKCTAKCLLAKGVTGVGGGSVLLCPQCGKDMLVKKNSKGFMLGCSGYPGCVKALWLPKEIESISVSDEICDRAKYPSAIRKLQVKLSRGAVPPGHPPSYLACICGCDELMNEYLGPRNQFSRWSTSDEPPNSNLRASQSSLNQSQLSRALGSGGVGSSKVTAFSRGAPSTTVATTWPTFNSSFSNTAKPNSTVGSSSSTSNSWPNTNNFTNTTFNNDSNAFSNNKNRSKNTQNQDADTVTCHCGSPALQLTCRKQNENQGRQFWKCENQICNFFLWDNERNGNSVGGGSNRGGRVGGGSRSWGSGGSSWGADGNKGGWGGSKYGQNNADKKRRFSGKESSDKKRRKKSERSGTTVRTCSRCKQPGHDIRKCPQGGGNGGDDY